jgi:methionine-rich copper-binding protein CopC
MRNKTWIFTRQFVAILVVICGIVLFSPRAALAHAILVSSQPAINSTVSGPEVAVLLKYSSRVDLEHSTLTLLDPDGKVEKISEVDRARQRGVCATLADPGHGWTHHSWHDPLPSKVEPRTR